MTQDEKEWFMNRFNLTEEEVAQIPESALVKIREVFEAMNVAYSSYWCTVTSGQ